MATNWNNCEKWTKKTLTDRTKGADFRRQADKFAATYFEWDDNQCALAHEAVESAIKQSNLAIDRVVAFHGYTDNKSKPLIALEEELRADHPDLFGPRPDRRKEPWYIPGLDGEYKEVDPKVLAANKTRSVVQWLISHVWSGMVKDKKEASVAPTRSPASTPSAAQTVAPAGHPSTLFRKRALSRESQTSAWGPNKMLRAVDLTGRRPSSAQTDVEMLDIDAVRKAAFLDTGIQHYHVTYNEDKTRLIVQSAPLDIGQMRQPNTDTLDPTLVATNWRTGKNMSRYWFSRGELVYQREGEDDSILCGALRHLYNAMPDWEGAYPIAIFTADNDEVMESIAPRHRRHGALSTKRAFELEVYDPTVEARASAAGAEPHRRVGFEPDAAAEDEDPDAEMAARIQEQLYQDELRRLETSTDDEPPVNHLDTEPGDKATPAIAGSQSDQPRSMDVERGVVDLTSTPDNPYPYMVRWDPSKDQALQSIPASPTIPISNEWERSEWLSHHAGLPTDTTDGDDNEAELHMSDGEWQKACEFNGFDPNEWHPKSGVCTKGWSKKYPKLAAQFWAATFVIKRLGSNIPLTAVAGAMGFGKTLVGWDTVHTWKRAQRYYGTIAIDDFRIPQPETGDALQALVDNDHNEYGNLTRLLGHAPRIRRGLTLIVTPVIDQFIGDRIKFLVPGFMKVVVVQSNAAGRGYEDKGIYEGFDAEVEEKDWPTDAELRAALSDDEYQEWHSPEFVLTVRKLLTMSDNAAAKDRPWLSDWCVLTPKSMLHNLAYRNAGYPRQGLNNGTGTALVSVWSLVLYDEFHEAKAMTTTWPTIAGLPGYPHVVGLSGTPYQASQDLFPIVQCATSRYFKIQGSGRTSLLHLTQTKDREDFKIGNTYAWNVSDAYTISQAENYSILGKVKHCSEFDRLGKSMKSLREYGDSAGALSAQAQQDEFQAHLDVIQPWIRSFIITFQPSFVWRPMPSVNTQGQPGLDTPPHNTFDIGTPIPEDLFDNGHGPDHSGDPKDWDDDIDSVSYQGLRELYLQCAEKAKTLRKETPPSFVQWVPEWRVLGLFPCLHKWRQLDPVLDDEMKGQLHGTSDKGPYSIDVALQILSAGKNSRVWHYMEEIHRMPAMQQLLEIIRGVRSQQNTFGKPRKHIITAYKPLNVALIRLYLMWLVEKGHLAGKLDDILAFIPPGAMKTKDKIRAIARFQTSNPLKEGYKDEPYLLLAPVTKIESGYTLAPADGITLVDDHFKPVSTKQVGGRISRNKMAQKAPLTEMFRLYFTSPWSKFGKWTMYRQQLTSDLVKLMRKDESRITGG